MQELSAALSTHVRVKSVTFVDEGKSTADVRLDVWTKSEKEEEEAIEKLKEAVGELVVKEQKLKLENYRPDTLLFIGNIKQDMDDAALREFFKEHGQIERAFVSVCSPDAAGLVGNDCRKGWQRLRLKGSLVAGLGQAHKESLFADAACHFHNDQASHQYARGSQCACFLPRAFQWLIAAVVLI
jgi:hypothetical protein